MLPDTKGKLLPIIDVAEFFIDSPNVSFDFEEQKPPKTIDQHLAKFAKRVKIKWGQEECFVDLRHVAAGSRLKNGQHPVRFVFDDLRLMGVNAIPIVSLDQDTDYRTSVSQVLAVDQRGVCLRMSLEKASSPDCVRNIDSLLKEIEVKPDQCDFILDLGAPDNFEPLDGFAALLQAVIKKLPFLDRWRGFGIIAHSLPVSVNKLPVGTSILPRSEWQLYKRVRANLEKSGIRVPTFGDYAVNHPTALNLDMRFIYPKASIKYTINDEWLISRGDAIRGRNGVGLGQFVDLCNLIVTSKYYAGPDFSFGDQYLLKCANSEVKPGQPSRFRQVATSHHLEMVIRDLANLGVF
jgi:hypothetical protein